MSVKQVPPIIEFFFHTKSIIYAEMKTTSSFFKGNQRFNGKRSSYGIKCDNAFYQSFPKSISYLLKYILLPFSYKKTLKLTEKKKKKNLHKL